MSGFRTRKIIVVAALVLVAMVFTSIRYVQAVGPDAKRPNSSPAAHTEGTTSTSVVTCCKIPGDANGDGIVNYDDEILLVAFVFHLNAPPLPCLEQGDANGSGAVNARDFSFLQEWFWIDTAASTPPVCPL